MKRNLLTVFLAIAFLGFAYIGITNITKTNHKLKIQDIQLKSKQSDLLELENDFNLLNKELEQKNIDAEKAKQLEQEKIQLQNQLEDAQRALKAKDDKVSMEKERIAQAASRLAVTQTAHAQSGNFYKDYIYQKESGNRTTAVNSIGCRGLGQACPGTKLPCGDDYACQDAWFTNYAIQRYGSWQAAYNFWINNHWW